MAPRMVGRALVCGPPIVGAVFCCVVLCFVAVCCSVLCCLVLCVWCMAPLMVGRDALRCGVLCFVALWVVVV